MCKELSIQPSNQLSVKNKEDIGEFFKNFNLSSNAQEDSIHHFMSELIYNYQLQVNGETYYFEEIEFYYSAPNHKDEIAIKRKQKAGDIFFHGYGFDICFETTDNSHGGILVRSLYKEKPDEQNSYIVLGPFNCLIEVLKNIDSNKELKISINNKILKNEQPRLYCCSRKLGETSKSKVFYNKPYRIFTNRVLQTNESYSKTLQKALQIEPTQENIRVGKPLAEEKNKALISFIEGFESL